MFIIFVLTGRTDEGREGKGGKEKMKRVRTNNGIESRVPIHQQRGTTSRLKKQKKQKKTLPQVAH